MCSSARNGHHKVDMDLGASTDSCCDSVFSIQYSSSTFARRPAPHLARPDSDRGKHLALRMGFCIQSWHCDSRIQRKGRCQGGPAHCSEHCQHHSSPACHQQQTRRVMCAYSHRREQYQQYGCFFSNQCWYGGQRERFRNTSSVLPRLCHLGHAFHKHPHQYASQKHS